MTTRTAPTSTITASLSKIPSEFSRVQRSKKVDDRFDYEEIRIYAIGLVNGLEITVIYTDQDNDERRIISAWRSEPQERRAYWQSLEA